VSTFVSRADSSAPPAEPVMPSPIARWRASPAGWAPPGQLLECQPERLGVGELAVEQAQGRLQRGQLRVRERDRGQEERLRRERVVLLLGEAVGRPVDRQVDAERVELGAVGVEAARERVLGHVRVALDVAPDLRRRHGPPLGHEVGDQRQLRISFSVSFATTAHLRPLPQRVARGVRGPVAKFSRCLRD
jgi:hypothetical protein